MFWIRRVKATSQGVTVALGLVVAVAMTYAQAGKRPITPRVGARVDQPLVLEPAHFQVTVETPGCRMEGEPRIRPFYGRATLIADALSNTGFAFRWDVAGAIRAARGHLRRTKIYVHWTMVPDAPRGAQGTPMLTVITVSLSPAGRVAVAGVNTSAPEAEPTLESPADRSVAVPDVFPSVTSAVCRLRVDEDRALRLQVWVIGDVTLLDGSRASANLGRVQARTAANTPGRIDVEWRRPERDKRDVVPVGLVVTWMGRTSRGTYVGGRTVVELMGSTAEAGVTGVRTTTRLIPKPEAPTTQSAAAP